MYDFHVRYEPSGVLDSHRYCVLGRSADFKELAVAIAMVLIRDVMDQEATRSGHAALLGRYTVEVHNG